MLLELQESFPLSNAPNSLSTQALASANQPESTAVALRPKRARQYCHAVLTCMVAARTSIGSVGSSCWCSRSPIGRTTVHARCRHTPPTNEKALLPSVKFSLIWTFLYGRNNHRPLPSGNLSELLPRSMRSLVAKQ